jgi:hypothetical protein
MSLVSVDRPTQPGRRYGQVERVGNITREERTFPKFGYRDANISLTVVPVIDGIEFELENLTEHSEKILWDEVVFADFDKTSNRVMHAGVRYLDRDLSHPPSVVAPRNLLKDIILPVNRVVEEREGFVHRPLFGSLIRQCTGETEEQFRRRTEGLKGALFSIVLPVEIAGVVNEYTLNFQIESVELRTGHGCPSPEAIAAQEAIRRGSW